MSAKFQPEWIERRANIDPETGARQKRLLIIGVNAAQIASAFSRLMPNCHIEAAARADNAVLAMASGHFDATLVDCRDDERFHRLAVVAARQFKEGRVALLASDQFLPDEKAVLNNLEIFGSQDDSARLLASLKLKAKMPAPKNPVLQSADFETALRAELEGLQNRAAPAAKTAAPAFAPSASPTAASELNSSPEYIENTAQFPDSEAPAFLADLTFELEEALLSDDAPFVTHDLAPGSETGPAVRQRWIDGEDLFGHPAAEFEQPAPPQETGNPLEDAECSGAPDLFSYVPAAPKQAATRSPARSPESLENLDLFGFPVKERCGDDIRSAANDAETKVSENTPFSGNLDLFDFIAKTSEPARTPPAAAQTLDSLDFFASVRAELEAIQRSQVSAAPDAADAAQELAAPASASKTALRANETAAAEAALRLHLPKIGDLTKPAAKTSLWRSTSWLAHLLPRLTPVYSLIYKNLALVILGALFTAFVAFGVMITFFLTSNKWSAPITLSRGHELVIKVERELSDLNVRRNQISEQIADAKKNLGSSQDELARARSLAGMIEGTISAEIKNRSELKLEIEKHTEALRRVAAQYGNDSLNPELKGNLEREFDRRLINRNIFEAGKLAQLEAAHRTALIRNEIAANEVEVSRLKSTLLALGALSGHVEGTQTPSAGAGGADLVPLLNQVIEVRKGSAEAASELKAAESRGALLSDSLETVESSISQIESTPLARAIKENITVLFVPYENAGQYEKGSSLYSCAIGIFFCSEAGKVGNVIEGETVATHPFFNKPVRGSFVEAQLTDQNAARKEIIHVKRRPLFF